MTKAQSERYQVQELLYERGGVRAFKGLDPLVGMPVLIYHFEGRANPNVEVLESAHIPGILKTFYDAGQGQLVTAYAKDYGAVPTDLNAADFSKLVLGSLTALNDAARAGIVHGDLNPDRFLWLDHHVLVEGFGACWQSEPGPYSPPEGGEATPAGDLFTWAKSIIALNNGVLSGELESIISSCLTSDPSERPSADQVLRRVETTLNPSPPPQPAAQTADFDLDIRDSVVPEMTPAQQRPKGGSDVSEKEPDPMIIHTDPGLATPKVETSRPSQKAQLPKTPEGPADNQGGGSLLTRGGAAVVGGEQDDDAAFVKDLPPGAIYHTTPESPLPPSPYKVKEQAEQAPVKKGNRRLILFVALLLGAAVLAYLAFWAQRDEPFAAPTQGENVQYLVTVNIEPGSLRNVNLIVDRSPPGSAFKPGYEIANRSDRIVLDESGVWQLRARFSNRISAPVTLRIPEDRNVTFVIPPG